MFKTIKSKIKKFKSDSDRNADKKYQLQLKEYERQQKQYEKQLSAEKQRLEKQQRIEELKRQTAELKKKQFEMSKAGRVLKGIKGAVKDTVKGSAGIISATAKGVNKMASAYDNHQSSQARAMPKPRKRNIRPRISRKRIIAKRKNPSKPVRYVRYKSSKRKSSQKSSKREYNPFSLQMDFR